MDRFFKQYICISLATIICCLLLDAFVYDLPKLLNYIFWGELLFNIVSLISVFFLPVFYIKKQIRPYLLFKLTLFIPMMVFCVAYGITTFVWLLVIPLFCHATFRVEKAKQFFIYYSCFILVLVLIGIGLKILVWGDVKTYIFLETSRINLLHLLIFILYISYCLYFTSKINSLKNNRTEQRTPNLYSEQEKQSLIDKYEQIFAQIEKYFLEEAPYLNQDFKIGQLSSALNSNIGYISKAISYKTDMNFTNFVNRYRIQKVKEFMDSNSRFTLEYIYLKSGFASQSSFNRAFKLQEGITPSEYNKKNHNSV